MFKIILWTTVTYNSLWVELNCCIHSQENKSSEL